MADETAKLVILVDSTSAKKASADLAALSAASGKAQASADALSASTVKQAAAQAESSARIKAMVGASLQRVAADKAATQASRDAMAARTARSASEVKAQAAQVAAQNAAMAASSQRAHDLATLDAIMAGNVQTTAAMTAAEDTLDRMMAAGAISAKVQQQAIDKLAKAKLVDAAATEVETRATNAATASRVNSRAKTELGVLASELASGNTGRLKRSGAALANQLGLFEKLLSPVGLAISAVVVAIGALGVAMAKAEGEESAFGKALATTGDAAGATVGNLQRYAKQLSALPGVTEHAAAGVVALVASSGKVRTEMIPAVAQLTLQLEQLGQKSATTVQNLGKLAGDPVKAIVALNDQYHFLTAATFEQIQALEQQGDEQAAFAVAVKAREQSVSASLDEVNKHLGLVQRGWRGIKTAAADTWDYMEGLFRSKPPMAKLQELAQELAKANEKLASMPSAFQSKGPSGDPSIVPSRSSTFTGGVSRQQQIVYIAKLKNEIQAQAQIADAARAAAAKKSASDRVAQYVSANNSVVEAMQPAAQRYAQAVIKIEADAEKRIADARKAGQAGAIPSILATENALLKQAQQQAKTPSVTKAHAATRTAGDADKARQAALTSLRQEITEAARQQQGADQYSQSLQQQVALRKQQLDLQIQSVSQGSQQAQRAQQLAQIQIEGIQKVVQLQQQRDRQLTQPGLSPGSAEGIKAQYATEIAATRNATAQQAKVWDDYYAGIDSARGKFANGFEGALADFQTESADVADQVHDSFTGVFDDMADSLATFVTTGKLSFKGFTQSLLTDLAKIEAKQAESKLLGLIGSFFGGMGGGGTSANNNPFANQYDIFGLGGARANGGPVTGGTSYLVGERGPEIFTPGASGAITPHGGSMTVNVQYVEAQGKDSQQRATDQDAFLRGLKETMRQSWQEFSQRDIAHNGPVSRSYQSAFGLRRATVVG